MHCITQFIFLQIFIPIDGISYLGSKRLLLPISILLHYFVNSLVILLHKYSSYRNNLANNHSFT